MSHLPALQSRALLRQVGPLDDLRVTVILCQTGPAPLRAVGHPGSPAAFCDVYVRAEDAPLFAEELRAHAQIGPVWTEFLRLPEARRRVDPGGWLWGWQRARAAMFPHRGLFRACARFQASWESQHPDPDVQQGRLLGLIAYRTAVQRGLPVAVPALPSGEAAD